MRPLSRLTVLAAGVALFAAACSAAATPTAGVAGTTATPGAMSTASTGAMASAMSSSSPVAGITIGSTSSATLGDFLTGQNGMTLYVLTKDTPDTSTCTGSCATTWPPLTVSSGASIAGPSGAPGTFATITRSDGTVQVTYDHMPLYYYSGDSNAGDTTGQGINGVWFVAPLSGSVASSSPSSGY